MNVFYVYNVLYLLFISFLVIYIARLNVNDIQVYSFIVLCCVVLCCVVLYCIVLYCIVLYCIVLYCIVLFCTVLRNIFSYKIINTEITSSPKCRKSGSRFQNKEKKSKTDSIRFHCVR